MFIHEDLDDYEVKHHKDAVKVKFPKYAIKKERDTIRGFVFDEEGKDFPGYLFKNLST